MVDIHGKRDAGYGASRQKNAAAAMAATMITIAAKPTLWRPATSIARLPIKAPSAIPRFAPDMFNDASRAGIPAVVFMTRVWETVIRAA